MYPAVPIVLPSLVSRVAPCSFAKPKVHDLHDAVLADHDVLGLDVAVDDAVLVGRGQTVRRLRADFQHLLLGEGRALIAQRLPVHMLHDDEELAVMLLDVVDGANVRMVERRRRACLLQKARPCIRLCRHLRREKFQRDFAIEFGIDGEIHLAHAARAEVLKDLVMCNGLTDH
jgi:hypothetical protein